MIITSRTVLISLFPLFHILTKYLFTLLAAKDYLVGLRDFVVSSFCVALGAVEPSLAADRANGNLSIEDVLAHFYITGS
jgi:hypothetical protein